MTDPVSRPWCWSNPSNLTSANKSKGSGLGLAICRKIVSEHNGKISLANRAESGASVRIQLPLA